MRPFNVKLLCCIGLLVGLGIIIGCGSDGDLLDQAGTRYSAYAVPNDNGEDTQEIDVWQDVCDTNGTYEDFLPFDVSVVITTDTTAVDFYIESYDVSFRPNEGTYCEESTPGCDYVDLFASELPTLTGTVLNPRHYNYSSPRILKNSTVTLSGLLVWTQGDKAFYGETLLNNPLLGEEVTNYLTGAGLGYYEARTADFTYDMQVILNCKTVENEDFSITTPWTPVHFANFDNC